MGYSGELPPRSHHPYRPSRRGSSIMASTAKIRRAYTPSAHLIPVIDRQINGSRLKKSRGLVHRRCGLGPPHRGPIPSVF
jgi:hypothetical protein